MTFFDMMAENRVFCEVGNCVQDTLSCSNIGSGEEQRGG